jgi:hypothetical protein
VIARALALTVALGLGACARPPGPVDLSGTWPAQVDDYAAANQAWTRRATLRADFSLTLEVYATFHAPPWHAARAAREARLRGGPTEAITTAARAAADGDLEFALVVTTHDRDENDLDRGERSVWRLALGRRPGVETPAERDRARQAPRAVIARRAAARSATSPSRVPRALSAVRGEPDRTRRPAADAADVEQRGRGRAHAGDGR